MGFLHTLLDHHAERRELAFMKWRASAYRDSKAWAEFIDAYLKANRLQQRINELDA